jgi:hypothetical protein
MSTAPFRIKATLDSRTDQSATTGLVNAWHSHHGGRDLQYSRQQQNVIKQSGLIDTYGTSLVDCTQRDIELWLGNAHSEGLTKRIGLTSASYSSSHTVLLHTYRGSCYLSGMVDLMFTNDAWDTIDGTKLAWFTTRQVRQKLRGTGVVSPYEPIADHTQRQIFNLLEKEKRLPVKRAIGQGGAVGISADGNTIAIGGCNDDYWYGALGAVWIFVRAPQALNQTLVQKMRKGTTGATQQSEITANEARAYNRLLQSMQLIPNQDEIEKGQPRYDSLYDRYLPISTTQWIQVAKLVGDGVIDFNANQGFALSLSADGRKVLVGGPAQNNSMGGVWFFEANDQDGWAQTDKWINICTVDPLTTGTDGEVVEPPKGEMVGISVACQPHGGHSIVGGRGVVVMFELTRYVCSLRLPEWVGHPLSVMTNNLHLFVGCADTDQVWVFDWASVLEFNTNLGVLPTPIQVLNCPIQSNPSQNQSQNTLSHAFGSSIASTWMPNKLVIGAHRWNYLSGAVMVYQWDKSDRKYIYTQLLSDSHSPAGSVQGQGSSVALSGQHGSLLVVGSMLSNDSSGGALQYLLNEETNKFEPLKHVLRPVNIESGSLSGCAVSVSARGDSVLIGSAGDGIYGSAHVFQ